MRIRHDLHAHSTFSDGWEMPEMAEAAARAGLSAIGFADHCPIGSDAFGRRARYDLTETYERRRTRLDEVAERFGIRCLDAAEVNYDPAKEGQIADFLDVAGFAYTIGSVHFVDGYDMTHPDLDDADEEERRTVVDAYVDWQVALIESELFDVVGHLDVVQRTPGLRGFMNESHYRRIAAALAESRTVPEINAGRLDRAYGRVHPDPAFIDLFARRNVSFVVGTDAHAPDQLVSRAELLADVLEELPVTVRSTPPAVA